MDIKEIKISDYNYSLPDDRIAKYPLKERDQSKLLVYDKGEVSEDLFYNLPLYLKKGTLLIYNNTKVIQARLHFAKETGGLIEIFLMEPAHPADYEQMFQEREKCSWFCMIGNLKKWKSQVLEKKFSVNGKEILLTAEKKENADANKQGTNHLIEFSWNNSEVSFAEIIDVIGELPIPPYLKRKTEESDKTTYQTVYSKIKGSVAAPTAGLHFTNKVLEDLDKKGIERNEVTLHVGAGTFKPVKSEFIVGHEMHTEYIVVKEDTIQELLAHDCKAVAVGTTSIRTVESLYYIGLKLEDNLNVDEDDLHVMQWEPYQKVASLSPRKALENILAYLQQNDLRALHTSTQIIIMPGYDFKYIKMLITNFHQPQSTLLLLISAFLKGDWRKVYDYALSHQFRFLSYGDSSLLIP